MLVVTCAIVEVTFWLLLAKKTEEGDSNCSLQSMTSCKLKCLNYTSTCTCQVSGSLSSLTKRAGSPSRGARFKGPKIPSCRSILINSSSCLRVAFLQRCSKLVRTSYAACPSILQCQSCQGSLGPPLSGLYCFKNLKKHLKLQYFLNFY
jgi:hypothetical protein